MASSGGGAPMTMITAPPAEDIDSPCLIVLNFGGLVRFFSGRDPMAEEV
jgi:hypothetical protein